MAELEHLLGSCSCCHSRKVVTTDRGLPHRYHQNRIGGLWVLETSRVCGSPGWISTCLDKQLLWSIQSFVDPVLDLFFLLPRGDTKTKETTGERNSSRWIHQRGNDSDTIGVQRGNGCSWLNVFWAAGVSLARQGQDWPVGQMLERNRGTEEQPR